LPKRTAVYRFPSRTKPFPKLTPMSNSPQRTSPLLVVAAWVIVALPLGWGLYQSVIKAKPIFTGISTPAKAPVPAVAPVNKSP